MCGLCGELLDRPLSIFVNFINDSERLEQKYIAGPDQEDSPLDGAVGSGEVRHEWRDIGRVLRRPFTGRVRSVPAWNRSNQAGEGGWRDGVDPDAVSLQLLLGDDRQTGYASLGRSVVG